MAMNLADLADRVLVLAQAISDYWDVELPKRHADYPFVHPGEDSGPPPPETAELEQFLTGLPDDTLYRLAAIVLIGQRRLPPPPRTDLADLNEWFDSPNDITSYVVESGGALAGELDFGLERLGPDGVADLETLRVPPVPANLGLVSARESGG
jgi:hypothetical protein